MGPYHPEEEFGTCGQNDISPMLDCGEKRFPIPCSGTSKPSKTLALSQLRICRIKDKKPKPLSFCKKNMKDFYTKPKLELHSERQKWAKKGF